MKEKYRRHNSMYLRDPNLIPLAQFSLTANFQGTEDARRTYCPGNHFVDISPLLRSLSVPLSEFRSFRETPAMFTPTHTETKEKIPPDRFIT